MDHSSNVPGENRMAKLIYDTIMKNDRHEQFDLNKVGEGNLELSGNNFTFTYDGAEYGVVIEKL